MNDQKAIWRNLVSGPHSEQVLDQVMWQVVSGLSEMTGQAISNDTPRVEKIPIAQVPARAGHPEAEMVGVYLVIGGGLCGQAILILSVSSALNLVDLLMGEQPGTSTELGEMERSALAEIGNMTLSYFLNATAILANAPELLQPSPPAVMVDMLGAILDVVVTPVGAVRDDMLIVDTGFGDAAGNVQGHFWVLPDPAIRDLG
ncbi:MAG: hypothetical protein V3S14_05410 [Anaerolineae bacterium]